MSPCLSGSIFLSTQGFHNRAAIVLEVLRSLVHFPELIETRGRVVLFAVSFQYVLDSSDVFVVVVARFYCIIIIVCEHELFCTSRQRLGVLCGIDSSRRVPCILHNIQ